MENAEIIKHEEQIKTLFNSVNEIKEEVNKIHDLTAQIAKISAQIENLSKRLLDNNTLLERQIEATTQRVRSLEEDRSFRAKYIWQTVAGTIVGALVGYLVNLMLK